MTLFCDYSYPWEAGHLALVPSLNPLNSTWKHPRWVWRSHKSSSLWNCTPWCGCCIYAKLVRPYPSHVKLHFGSATNAPYPPYFCCCWFFSSKNITRLIKAMKVGESEREFDFIPQTASNVLVGPDFRYGKRQGTRKSSSCPHKPVNVSEVACKDFQRGICHASSGGIRFLNSTANRAKPS